MHAILYFHVGCSKKIKTCIIEKVPYLNSIKRLSFTNLSLSISAPFSSNIKCFVVLLYLHSHDKISCGTVKVDFHHRALNFHVCAWPFIHCLLFIYTRKFYVCSHGKITRQWKSTLTLDCQLLLGKNESALIPSSLFGEDQSPHLGDSGNRV